MATSRHIPYRLASDPTLNSILGSVFGESEPRQWRSLLVRLLNERDNSKLEAAAADLEDAIFLRYQQLQALQSREAIQERRELKEACERLAIVRINKLGYPDWR
jgi:hypothetical protein